MLIVINPDAHNEDGISDIMYGVNVARRGWLEKGDVFNTRSVREVGQVLCRAEEEASSTRLTDSVPFREILHSYLSWSASMLISR